MKHWHFDLKKDDYMTHSHEGGEKWHEHPEKRLIGYGRRKTSFSMKKRKY